MAVDFESKVPLYYQLKQALKQSILEGTLREGDRVPSERELAEKYHLSSTTIKRALSELVHEQLVVRTRGKGSFVTMRRVKRDLRKVLSFTNNMREAGLVPSSKVLSQTVVPANSAVRKQMGIDAGAEVIRLVRLRLANDVAMMLETRYIRADLCPGLLKHDLSASLWNLFENVYGHKPYRHLQTVRIKPVSGKAAEFLTVRNGSPAYLIKGVTYLEDGRPIECEKSLYRGDGYELVFEAVAE